MYDIYSIITINHRKQSAASSIIVKPVSGTIFNVAERLDSNLFYLSSSCQTFRLTSPL